MVDGAKFEWSQGAVELEPAECCDNFVGVARAGLGDSSGEGVHGHIADHRAKPRIIVPTLLIGRHEGRMRRRLDRVPRIAGNDPSDRRLVLERIEIFRLAREQAHDGAVLERAPRGALAHELGEVAAEQHVENGVGLGVVYRLHDGPGIDLAERRGLLGHELDIGLRLFQHLLEPGRSRLAILEIRINHGPAFLLRCDGVGHQHRDLHVGRGPQAERILVPVLPGDLVGQRLGRQEEHLLLARELGDREADIGQESTGDDVCPLARDELVGNANRVARVCTIIARDKFKLFAEDTGLGVDFLDCELPALLVRFEERRLPLVTIELTDLHGVLGDSRGTETDGARCDEPSELESGAHAVLHVLGSALCGRGQVVSRHETLSRSLDRAFDTGFSVRPSESGDLASGSGFPLSRE